MLLYFLYLGIKLVLPGVMEGLGPLFAEVSDPQAKKAVVAWFGQQGYPMVGVFFGVQLLQVLFAPIPGQLTGVVGGYLFGFWLGLGLTMAGLATGSLLAMGGVRWLGRPFLQRMVPQEILLRMEHLINRGKVVDFFIIFLLPAFPDDAVCLMAGLTRLPIWQLWLASIVGRLPGMAVLTLLGSGTAWPAAWVSGLVAMLSLLVLFVWLFYAQDENGCQR